MEASAQQFDDLIDILEDLSETIRYVGIVATNFDDQSQDVLNLKINDMVVGLKKLNDVKDNFDQVQVPYEVLSYIDKGRNPQLYTKDCLERAKLKNDEVQEKINSLETFRESLKAQLKKTQPNVVDQYESGRADPS